jgi:hypothetical protein
VIIVSQTLWGNISRWGCCLRYLKGGNMCDINEALLRLRASMILKEVELKVRYSSEEDKKSVFMIRAYYLGKEFPNAALNPFLDLEHPFRDDLVEGVLVK